MYDSRIGRRWERDPKPIYGISDYACFLNNPVFNSDPNGDIVKFDDIRSFFHFIGKAIVNKEFRKQLLEQHKKTRTTTDKNGREYTKPIYHYYKYDKNSANSSTQAATDLDKRVSNGKFVNDGRDQHYQGKWSKGSERIISLDERSYKDIRTDFKDGSSRVEYSNHNHKRGTLTINYAVANDDTGDDKITVYHGTKELRVIILPRTLYTPEGIQNPLENLEIQFDSSKPAKIKLVISSDNNKAGDPGAYYLKATIKRK